MVKMKSVLESGQSDSHHDTFRRNEDAITSEEDAAYVSELGAPRKIDGDDLDRRSGGG